MAPSSSAAVAQPVAVGGTLRPTAGAAPASAAAQWGRGRGATMEPVYRWPWQGVNWSPAYFFFLVYLFSVTTYQINAGSPAMAAAILAIPFSSEDRYRIPLPFGLLLGFATVATLTYKLTEYRIFTWDPLLDLLKVIAIGVVAVSVLNNRRRIRFFLFYFMALYALFPVRGALFNYFIYGAAEQGRVAWNGIFSNPNDYSTMMFLPLGITMGQLYTERDRFIRLCAFAGIGLIALTMFMTGSRGGLLSLFFGAGLVFLGMKQHRRKFLMAGAGFALIIALFAPATVWSRLSGLDAAVGTGNLAAANDQNSAAQRFELWKVAFTVGKAFPVTGVGWGAYPNANAEFSRSGVFSELARGARDAHNTYLTLFAETGVIGVGLWLSAFLIVAIQGYKTVQYLRPFVPEYAEQLKFMMVSLASLASAAMFGSFAHWSSVYIHLAVITALGIQGRLEAERLRAMYGAPPR